jgi:hypothetical protein
MMRDAAAGAAAAPGRAFNAHSSGLSRGVLGALRFYKRLISPLLSGACRYLPTCADYTAEAVERHGVAAGTALGVHRLARCQPVGGSGYDPVPAHHPWRSLLSRRPGRCACASNPASSDPSSAASGPA